ncbi:unnamed protein product, partial [Citrullus colocynthis]
MLAFPSSGFAFSVAAPAFFFLCVHASVAAPVSFFLRVQRFHRLQRSSPSSASAIRLSFGIFARTYGAFSNFGPKLK